MRIFVFAAASLALVFAVSASPIREERDMWETDSIPVFYDYHIGDKCPAKIFSDGCNVCVCATDGHTSTCTSNICQLDQYKIATRWIHEYPHNDLYAETGTCKPNTHFLYECNLCYCTYDGQTASCTDIGCRSVVKPHIDGYQSGDACVPDKIFYDRCNSCTCSSNGRSAKCTLNVC